MHYQKYLLALAVCQAKGWQQQVEEMARCKGHYSPQTMGPKQRLIYFASVALKRGDKPDEAMHLKAQMLIRRAQQIFGGLAA